MDNTYLMMLPEKIKTRTPKDLKPLNMRQHTLIAVLDNYTADELRILFEWFTGNSGKKNKTKTIADLVDLLIFPSQKEFDAWFYALPPLSQQILWLTVFEEYVPLIPLEQACKQPLLVETRDGWDYSWIMKPELKLSFLQVYEYYNAVFITITPIFRQAILPWFEPPAEGNILNCKGDDWSSETTTWNNSIEIADSFPLLCGTLKAVWANIDRNEQDRIIRLGFKKKIISELRASSGFPEFDKGFDAPDCVDMIVRFVLCMTNFHPERPENGQKAIKELITHFFNEKSAHPNNSGTPDRNFLEFNLFLDHLSRTPGYFLNHERTVPLSRQIFYYILLEIAKDGGVFDADKLTDYIHVRGLPFSFCEPQMETSLKLKADALEIRGFQYIYDDEEVHYPVFFLRHHLLVKPVFKAYCYLFASLGLLEITQKPPLFCRHYRDKALPISMYDSVHTIRITEFGRWCLGLSDTLPPKPAREYQALADKELLLVTVKGHSLERKVFLDRIGQKLGEDRWRISPASFIDGCTSKNQIEERISRFKALIDPDPGAHWKALFTKTLNRAGLFDSSEINFTVYKFPDDPEIVEELLRDQELKNIILRAEGQLLLIPAQKQRKFFALLAEHGIAHF